MIESDLNIRKIDNLRDFYEKTKADVEGRNLKGFTGGVYTDLLHRLGGMAEGIVVVVAKANIGKTTLAVSIALDIVDKHDEDDDCPRVVIYSFDDNFDSVCNSIIAFYSRVDRDIVKEPPKWSDESGIKIKKAMEKFTRFIQEEKIEVVCLENILTWGNLIADLERQRQINKRLVVVIDGISQVDYDKRTKRLEANEAKSIGLKQICNEYHIPIIVTQEVSKGCGKRPQMENIAETRRWEFDAKAIIAMSDIDDEIKNHNSEQGASYQYPEVVIDILKNKMSAKKGYLFGVLKTDTCCVEHMPTTRQLMLRKMDYEFEKTAKDKKKKGDK